MKALEKLKKKPASEQKNWQLKCWPPSSDRIIRLKILNGGKAITTA